jgi:hypothetical protein
MAKSASGKSGGPARIRFVMLDAEVPDGDLSQVSQAMQNALRAPDGAAGMRRLIASTLPSKAATPSSDVVEAAELEEAADEQAVAPEASPNSSPTRANGPRKGKTPNVVDVDLTSDPSFADFASAKKPSSDQKRYLVVAAWFKLHRNLDAITADHVYTCYRFIKWPSNIPDFAQPLRNLKHKKLMDLRSKGVYAINHLGLAEVDKLGAG